MQIIVAKKIYQQVLELTNVCPEIYSGYDIKCFESTAKLDESIKDGPVVYLSSKLKTIPDIYNLKYLKGDNRELAFFTESLKEADVFLGDREICADGLQRSGAFYLSQKVTWDGELPIIMATEIYLRNPEGTNYQRALFLDRDGVINIDTGYPHNPSELIMREGIGKFLQDIQSLNFKLYILTNQAGVARGKFDEAQVKIFNDAILSELERSGIRIEDIQYCPYHYANGVGEYKRKSYCRKPHAGMLVKICEKFPIDLNLSFMVGDKVSDQLDFSLPNYLHIKAGHNLDQATMPVCSDFDELFKLIESGVENKSR